MVINVGKFLAWLLIALLAGACGDAPQKIQSDVAEERYPAADSVKGARPLPPIQPCQFPDNDDQLALLTKSSDRVVRGLTRSVSIEEVTGAPLDHVTHSQFEVTKNLSGETGGLSTIDILTTGGTQDRTLLKAGGEYILFLKHPPGQLTYYVLKGTEGRFIVRDGTVFKYCVDYGHSSDKPASGKGQGQPAAAFEARIQAVRSTPSNG